MMYLLCAQIAVLTHLVSDGVRDVNVNSNLRSYREVYACQTDSSISRQLQKEM